MHVNAQEMLEIAQGEKRKIQKYFTGYYYFSVVKTIIITSIQKPTILTRANKKVNRPQIMSLNFRI